MRSHEDQRVQPSSDDAGLGSTRTIRLAIMDLDKYVQHDLAGKLG